MRWKQLLLTTAVLVVAVLAGADGAGPQLQRPVPAPYVRTATAEAPPPRSAAPVDTATYRLDAEIVGPVGGKIEAGRPVRLKAAVKVTRDAATTVLMEAAGDDIPTAYEWQLANAPAGYSLADWTDSDGRSVVFSDPQPGEYRFVLAVAKWIGGPRPLLRTVSYTLTCTPRDGPTPAPQPEPPKADPTPQEPSPPPTPQPTAFARSVRDAVQRLVPAADRDVAVALAQSYAGNALLIESGAWTVIDAKRGKQRDANAVALGAKAASWKPFLEWMTGELKAFEAAGSLSAPADVAKKWAEIAAGLLLSGSASPQ